MTGQELCTKIAGWINEQVAAAGAAGVVVGLSGGIDSAVTVALAKRAYPDTTLGVIMPCHSNPQDMDHALLVAERFNIQTVTVLLDEVYDLLLRQLGAKDDVAGRTALAMANIKPRLRMTALYYFANKYNYLVAGTGNKSELTVGYFTKYGDGGVDILPIGNLVKAEVRSVAEFLGVPREIIAKPPSAGLWGGQTDEGEMGITYAQLDTYITRGDADPDVEAKIETMRRRSRHKRMLPLIPDFV